MRKASLIIVTCLLMAFVMTVYGQQQRELQPIMKEIQPTSNGLTAGINNRTMTGADVVKDAEKLAGLFKEVSSYMKTKNLDKAVQWANEASAAASDLAKATTANDVEAMKTARAGFQKQCKTCHDVHREQLPDKTFKLKVP